MILISGIVSLTLTPYDVRQDFAGHKTEAENGTNFITRPNARSMR